VAKRPSLYEVITAAVADLTEHGFDRQSRVDDWMAKIEAAAHRTMTPQRTLDALLRDTMRGLYQRLVDSGSVARLHPGVSKFTLQNVKPKLRAELERRIMTSADLIKLNREQSIAKTLQRFQGWASSVPAGGSRVQDKRKVKYDAIKSLKQLPFEERRVIIDQGHKLTSSINDVIAQDGGAIAAEWVSHAGEIGYNFRPSHAARQRKIYLIRNSWAHKKGLVKAGPDGYTDEITQPAEEPFCIPGDSPIELLHQVEKLYRRWYDGHLVSVNLSDGSTIRATPNHPVMGENGWVSIGSVQKGDRLLKVRSEGVVPPELHDQQRFSSVADLFDAVARGGFPQEVRAGMAPDFHGDGTDENVDVISLARPLWISRKVSVDQGSDHGSLARTDFPVTAARAVHQDVERLGAAANGVMGLCQRLGAMPQRVNYNTSIAESAEDSRSRHADGSGDLVGVYPADVHLRDPAFIQPQAGPFTHVDPSLLVPIPNGGHRNAECLGDTGDSDAIGSEPVEVLSVDRRSWSGHVYNLQMASGWYAVNGIITSNCRCYYRYIYSVRRLREDMVTAKGKAAMDAARAKMEATS